jgi:hypothetical protein
MSNQTPYAFAALVVLIQVGALGLTLWRRSVVFLAALNLIVAVGVLIGVIPILADYRSYNDEFLEFIAIVFATEAIALIASLAWLASRRLDWLVWIAFVANAALSGVVLDFALTFKITRLI